jgi:hypothetical protein
MVQLHSSRGYRSLFKRAGFPAVRLLDIAPSYNDYDVIIDPEDAASYRFLWKHGLVRSFNSMSRALRRRAVRLFPTLLGSLSYAYLVIAGKSVVTLLDAAHPIWNALQPYSVLPGTHRFGCRGPTTGSFSIVVHDGEDISAIVGIGSMSSDRKGAGFPDLMRPVVSPDEFTLGAHMMYEETLIKAWVRASRRAATTRIESETEEEVREHSRR